MVFCHFFEFLRKIQRKKITESLAQPLDGLVKKSFKDNLGRGNFLNSNYKEWCDAGRKGTEPLKGEAYLTNLKAEWKKAGMKTLMDLAVHYSKYDVVGLSRAVRTRLKKIKIFKNFKKFCRENFSRVSHIFVAILQIQRVGQQHIDEYGRPDLFLYHSTLSSFATSELFF